MTSDIPRQVAEVVSFWEAGTGYSLVTAYAAVDLRDDTWYAEWLQIRERCCYPGQTHSRGQLPELFNGFSSNLDPVAELRDQVRRVSERHGVIIDHVVKRDGQVLVFWHRPGVQIRLYGTAPAAAAVPPMRVSQKGVA